MKKTLFHKGLLLLLAIGLLLALTGCNKTEITETEDEGKEILDAMILSSDFTDAIETAVEEAQDGLNYLLGEDWLTVELEESNATITVRAYAYYAIPYVAEEMISILEELTERYEVTIGSLTVTSYLTSDGEIFAGSQSAWVTTDLENGTYYSEADHVVETEMTVEELLAYYSDWDSWIGEKRLGFY